MEYRVRFVADELLPQGHDWALCSERADGLTLCIRRGARTYTDRQVEALLESAWQGFRELAEVRPVLIPQQVDSSH